MMYDINFRLTKKYNIYKPDGHLWLFLENSVSQLALICTTSPSRRYL